MSTTTPILNLSIPELEDDANIEEATHPFAKELEKFVLMRFSSTGARASSLTSPTKGMFTYIQSTGTLELYSGTGWVVVARTGAWLTFTPTLLTVGGTLGNGTLTGRYQVINSTVDVIIKFIFGSTTSYGSSFISFGNIPVPVRVGDFQATPCWLYDSSLGEAYPGSGLFEGSSAIRPLSQDGNIFGSTPTPFDWATGDTIVLHARYET